MDKRAHNYWDLADSGESIFCHEIHMGIVVLFIRHFWDKMYTYLILHPIQIACVVFAG